MTITPTSLLSLPLITTGTESGTWGDDVNNGLTQYLDICIAGTLALTQASFTANALTLANTAGTSSNPNIGTTTAQYYILSLSSLTGANTITAPSSSRTYVVVNQDSTYSVTIKASGQSGVTVVAGEKAIVAFNGTDYVKISNASGAGVFTTISASGQITSTVATGTAPFVVASTTNVANLNASSLSGATFASPGPIGSTTPSTGSFTTLTATGVITANTTTNSQSYTTTGAGTITISSGTLGTINNMAIGGTTAAAATFTSITATGAITLNTTSNNQSYTTTGSATITIGSGGAGTINNMSIGATTPLSGAFTTLGATGVITHNTTTNNQSYTTTGAGTITISSGTAGTINNMSIGATTPLTGAFTTLSTTGNAVFGGTGAITLPVGTTAQEPGTPTSGMLRFNSTTVQFEGYNGSAWASVGGAAISNDTTTASNEYPLFASATSGTALTVYTSNAKLLYKPSTGDFTSSQFIAGNGLVVNNQTIGTSYSIPTGYSAMSTGPVTLSSGVSVTLGASSKWVVL
jgi:hypothetical protein